MKTIDEFDINEKMKIRLQVGEYGGNERVDIRQWVEVNNNYIPTKSGINFNSEWLDRFIKMADKLKKLYLSWEKEDN